MLRDSWSLCLKLSVYASEKSADTKNVDEKFSVNRLTSLSAEEYASQPLMMGKERLAVFLLKMEVYQVEVFIVISF